MPLAYLLRGIPHRGRAVLERRLEQRGVDALATICTTVLQGADSLMIGVIELTCLLLYLIPATSVLGAVLMTGLHTGHTRLRGNGDQSMLPEEVTVSSVTEPLALTSPSPSEVKLSVCPWNCCSSTSTLPACASSCPFPRAAPPT